MLYQPFKPSIRRSRDTLVFALQDLTIHKHAKSPAFKSLLVHSTHLTFRSLVINSIRFLRVVFLVCGIRRVEYGRSGYAHPPLHDHPVKVGFFFWPPGVFGRGMRAAGEILALPRV
jgi:hypothetical protein